MLSLTLLSVALFISTHVDDLVLLLSLFAARKLAKASIVLGQYIGVSLLLFGSLLCAEVALAIPHSYLRWLGLFPAVLGIAKLPSLFQKHSGETTESVGLLPSGHQALGVAALTVASGGDNIAVYLPLFATRSPHERMVIVTVFLVMTAVWCLFAHWLAYHRRLRAPIHKWGSRLFPLVLIALGLKILLWGSQYPFRSLTKKAREAVLRLVPMARTSNAFRSPKVVLFI